MSSPNDIDTNYFDDKSSNRFIPASHDQSGNLSGSLFADKPNIPDVLLINNLDNLASGTSMRNSDISSQFLDIRNRKSEVKLLF